jgi:hypothetical protein
MARVFLFSELNLAHCPHLAFSKIPLKQKMVFVKKRLLEAATVLVEVV